MYASKTGNTLTTEVQHCSTRLYYCDILRTPLLYASTDTSYLVRTLVLRKLMENFLRVWYPHFYYLYIWMLIRVLRSKSVQNSHFHSTCIHTHTQYTHTHTHTCTCTHTHAHTHTHTHTCTHQTWRQPRIREPGLPQSDLETSARRPGGAQVPSKPPHEAVGLAMLLKLVSTPPYNMIYLHLYTMSFYT